MRKTLRNVIAFLLTAFITLQVWQPVIIYADEQGEAVFNENPFETEAVSGSEEITEKQNFSDGSAEQPEETVEQKPVSTDGEVLNAPMTLPVSAGPAVSVKDLDGNELRMEVRVSGAPARVSGMSVAIWSQERNQDDLVWYKMQKSGEDWVYTFVPASHKSAGLYFAHAYASGSPMQFIGDTTFNVSGCSDAVVTVENIDKEHGTCRIVVSGLSCPSGIKSVKVPVWCAANQSDIKWYNAQFDAENSVYYADVDIANHRGNQGTYTAHVYAKNNNDIESIVGHTTVALSKGEPGEEGEKEIRVDADDQKKTITVVLPSSKAAGLSNIRAAVWTVSGNQDDLKWVSLKKKSTGDYTAEIPYNTFKRDGNVAVHFYGARPGNDNVYIWGGGTRISFATDPEEPEEPDEPDEPITDEPVVIAEVDNKNGTFTITLKNAHAAKGIAEVQFPIWSEKDGQDDIIWYKAEKVGDDYVLEGTFASHDYCEGIYQCHAYVKDKTGSKKAVCGTRMEYKDESENRCELLDIGEEGAKNTDYRVVVPTRLAANAASVKAAVWSGENGQDDLRWYSASQNGSAWALDFCIRDHTGGGKYYVHVYEYDARGKGTFVQEFTFTVKGITSSDISAEPNGEGGLVLKAENIESLSGVGRLRAAVWTEKNGQDDIEWTDFSGNMEDGYTCLIDFGAHNFETGTYIAHFYGESGNGIESVLGGLESTVSIKPGTYSLNGGENNSTRHFWIYEPDAENVTVTVYPVESGAEEAFTYTCDSMDGIFECILTMRNHKVQGEYVLNVEADGTGVIETGFVWTALPDSDAELKARKVLDSIGWDLRNAYNWAAGMTYSRACGYNTDVPAGWNHAEYFANWGFDHYSGNCYCMAATFLYMARLMGYEGHFVEGYILLTTGGMSKHGWCELVIDGTSYVFDPNFTNETGRNGYQITYGQSGTWKYRDWQIVD